MGVHLVTGYAGKEHITSADHGAYNAGTYGPGKYVLRTGNMFAAEVISNNLIKIKDGDLINQGRHINIAVNDYEECEIDNGQQSLKRNDLIVVRYTKNNETMIETAQVLVLKGVSSATPADPKYVTGDILNGAETDDFPLYRVRLNGLNIEKVEPLFSTIVSVKDILSLIGNKDISKLGDGTITGGLSTLNTDLVGKAPTNHNHDTRYYTKAQVDTDLAQKQDKLTNPLTQADVVNNLSSTATNKPLSANQGKILYTSLNKKQDALIYSTYVNTETTNSTGAITLGIDISGFKLSQKPKCAFLEGQHTSFQNYIYSYDSSTATLAVFVVNYGTPNTTVTNRYGVLIMP